MDNFIEDVALFASAVGVGGAIGLGLLLYKRRKDKSNRPNPQEQKRYIRLCQDQKRDGWSFADREKFLLEAGFRKNVADAILGQAERLEEIPMSDEQISTEVELILSQTANRARDEFLTNTFCAHRDGALAHIDQSTAREEARAKRANQFVTLYNNLFGELIDSAMKARPFESDEFLVAGQKACFLMTNKTLYLFMSPKSPEPVKIIRLSDIREYRTEGSWTYTLYFKLTSGQELCLKPFESAPQEEYISAFSGR